MRPLAPLGPGPLLTFHFQLFYLDRPWTTKYKDLGTRLALYSGTFMNVRAADDRVRKAESAELVASTSCQDRCVQHRDCAKFGDAKYITAWWNHNLYVDYKLIEARKLNKVEVENAAQDVLRDYPGVEAVYTRTQMEQGT